MLRQHNADLPAERHVEFCGLDVYSMYASMTAVLDYLERVDPAAAESAPQRYGCLTPWQAGPALYGRSVVLGHSDTCEDAVVEQLKTILENRLDYMRKDGEDYFDVAQNARIVRTAERYYRIMYRGSTES